MPAAATIEMRPDAFLIVQRGSARLEIVPLSSHLRTTVGRAPSNRVVLTDPKCSRRHCELFHRDGRWYVRDLDSRNGITVDGIRVENNWPLEVGQAIGIGACSLVYTDREPRDAIVPANSPTAPFAVIERKSGTRYDPPGGSQFVPRGRHGVAELFQLAQAMTTAPDVATLTASVLDGLLQGTHAHFGAILLVPALAAQPTADSLEAAAVRAPAEFGNPQFSEYLSEMVLADREALLVHDISQHDALSDRQSLNELAAQSAICAPLRIDDRVLGVIHLYSTAAAEPLDAEQLEFTLAVADQMAAHLALLRDRERLEQGISCIENTNRELRDQLQAETELIGDSESLQKVRRSIGRVAPTDATVLIRGESGVGKELVARAVHYNSDRKAGPFVCVNCAALTESLLESELFGHEKGAFTGAAGQKAGKFEQADGGTLFLDEIGEMNPDLQSKFLRVLEGQPFERVGGGKAITVDVRVVTATNRHLERAVKEGRFRGDLYFRLQVIEITVPPLRDHPEDIPIIAQHFVQRFARKARVRVRGFSREALDILIHYAWPGNVRELRNVVERAVILADHDVLTPSDITLSGVSVASVQDTGKPPDDDPERPTEPGQRPQAAEREFNADDAIERIVADEMTIDELDRRYLSAVLERCAWNKSHAARVLGIERTTLDRRLKRYGMRRHGDNEG